MSRTKEQLTAEFGRLAVRAGQIAYQVDRGKKDLSLIYDEMADLNLEMVAVEQAEAKKESK
jgi:hypothetical protein